MTLIFEGKKFAERKEKILSQKVRKLIKANVFPKLVSILVGNDPASILYTNLKKKAAERIGCAMEINKFPSTVSVNQLNQLISKLNSDTSVHGIMIQLPLPKEIANHKLSIINSIVPEKDVDGLQEKSLFVPATVKAVVEIIREAKLVLKHDFEKAVVVGAKGMVGKPLVSLLKTLEYHVTECDLDTKDLKSKTLKADLLISASGKPGLIKSNMIKSGAAIIDVGAPKGDVEKSAYEKAAIVSPVPGGVGPVTISCLLENLILAATDK